MNANESHYYSRKKKREKKGFPDIGCIWQDRCNHKILEFIISKKWQNAGEPRAAGKRFSSGIRPFPDENCNNCVAMKNYNNIDK